MNISIYRSIAGQYENLRSVNTVPMMNAISHSIEEQVINHALPVNFYAGFERFSRFPAQTRLYGRLGAAARRVYIFGVPDIKPAPISGVEYISVEPNSPLAREWFLLVDTPDFWCLLATEEVAGQDEATGGRKFNGIWSFDSTVVERASLLISQAMGTVYQPVRQRNYDQQNIHIAEISAGMIARLDRAHVEKRRSWAQANTLHYVIEILAKAQTSIEALKQVTNTLFTVFGATGVSLLIHAQADRFALVAADGETAPAAGTIQLANTTSGRAVSQATSVSVANMRQEHEREPLLPTSQAVIAVPMIGRQRLYGVILVGHLDVNRWTGQDQKVIEAVSNLLAFWIESMATGTIDNDKTQHETNVAALRSSLDQLITLHSVLRMEGSPNPRQTELIRQIDRLTVSMAQQIGNARKTQLEMPAAIG